MGRGTLDCLRFGGVSEFAEAEGFKSYKKNWETAAPVKRLSELPRYWKVVIICCDLQGYLGY